MKPFIIFITFTTCTLLNNKLYSQSRNIFFEYSQDSIKSSRIVNLSAPTNTKSFAIKNSVVTDYIGNTRISLLTGIITSKKDTVLALHSLSNGAGNLNLDAEIPIGYILVRELQPNDYIGISLQPRISSIINQNQTFETSLICYELGMNLSGRLTGDLGNIALKYNWKNALVLGNNQFVRKSYNFSQNGFYFSSAQVKIRTGSNILALTLPLVIVSFDETVVKGFPVFVGYSLLF